MSTTVPITLPRSEVLRILDNAINAIRDHAKLADVMHWPIDDED